MKKEEGKAEVKKLFLVAFVVSGLAFAPVQRSDAQIEIGIPGIGTGPGVSYGYPHFEYGYYPRGGYYYRQPVPEQNRVLKSIYSRMKEAVQ